MEQKGPRILYNVTFLVEKSIEAEWLSWMKNFHIPDVLSSGLFPSYIFSKVTSDQSVGGMTYAVQYTCNSRSDLEKYEHLYSADLQKKHQQKFGSQTHAFRTLLEIVEER